MFMCSSPERQKRQNSRKSSSHRDGKEKVSETEQKSAQSEDKKENKKGRVMKAKDSF